jgi:hypothetical protein
MVEMFDNPIYLDKPDYIIPLKGLTTPTQIYNFCRTNNISHFGYGFRFVRNSYFIEQIKFGYSAPDPNARSVQHGERLVRQASWLPGWSQTVHSSHGYELWHGCEQLITAGILPANTLYEDFEIAIWSVDSRINVSGFYLTRKEIAEFIESDLCNKYVDKFGKLPHLNIADPTRNKTYRGLTKTNYMQLFEEK